MGAGQGQQTMLRLITARTRLLRELEVSLLVRFSGPLNGIGELISE